MYLSEAVCRICTEGGDPPWHSLEYLQEHLGVDADGAYGPRTHAAVLAHTAALDVPRLRLVRTEADSTGTYGHLDLEGLVTVERPWLDNRRRVSCIPKGRYLCYLGDSPRFGADTPHIEIVPERDHILMHVANFPHEVEGCIGVGMHRMSGGVGKSRAGTEILRGWLREHGGVAVLNVEGLVG